MLRRAPSRVLGTAAGLAGSVLAAVAVAQAPPEAPASTPAPASSPESAPEDAPSSQRPVAPQPNLARPLGAERMKRLSAAAEVSGADWKSRAQAWGLGEPISLDELVGALLAGGADPAQRTQLRAALAPRMQAYEQLWRAQSEESGAVLHVAMQEALVRTFAPDTPFFRALDEQQRALWSIDQDLLRDALEAAGQPSLPGHSAGADALLRWRRRMSACSEIGVGAPWCAVLVAGDGECAVAQATAAGAAGAAGAGAGAGAGGESIFVGYAQERLRLLEALRRAVRDARRNAPRIEMEEAALAADRGASREEAARTAAARVERPIRRALAELMEFEARWLAERSGALSMPLQRAAVLALCGSVDPASTERAAGLEEALARAVGAGAGAGGAPAAPAAATPAMQALIDTWRREDSSCAVAQLLLAAAEQRARSLDPAAEPPAPDAPSADAAQAALAVLARERAEAARLVLEALRSQGIPTPAPRRANDGGTP